MKVEFGPDKPGAIAETWPGQFGVFAWLENVLAIPQVLSLITTIKENGKSNACLHGWGTFAGDDQGYFCVLSMLKDQHTYGNIVRDSEFCVNFVSRDLIRQCHATVEHNEVDDHEIGRAGLTAEPSRAIAPPRVRECFLSLECRLEWEKSLCEPCSWGMLCGRIVHVAFEKERFEQHTGRRYGEDGYLFNVHSPRDPFTGTEEKTRIGYMATLEETWPHLL